MNWPYLHTLINHFPIILVVTGAAAAVTASSMHRRGVWLYALASLVLAGVTMYPAFFTGDAAADALEHTWYVVPGMVHDHEESAELALWVVLASGVVALVVWWRLARRDDQAEPARWQRAVVVTAALASAAAISYTSILGGRIVHESPRLRTPPPGMVVDSTGRGP